MSFAGKVRAFRKFVKRRFEFALVLTFCMLPLQSATLERLSLDEMISKSTAIVRGKVTGSSAALSGPIVYTHYAVAVSETLKGGPQSFVDVVVPGGVANNVRQSFAGSPEFKTGDEFVFFLWTGRSGLTQIIGLTQGLFGLAAGPGTSVIATRSASRELMLERGTNQQVKDQTLTMSLNELRARITNVLGGSARQ
ncbi:MAG: hypothetical protein C5B51_04530 [Terriglobia bacterium]|nr:MAG: hypothetical protein C5B51_04530 [Terriglobia bacterium]